MVPSSCCRLWMRSSATWNSCNRALPRRLDRVQLWLGLELCAASSTLHEPGSKFKELMRSRGSVSCRIRESPPGWVGWETLPLPPRAEGESPRWGGEFGKAPSSGFAAPGGAENPRGVRGGRPSRRAVEWSLDVRGPGGRALKLRLGRCKCSDSKYGGEAHPRGPWTAQMTPCAVMCTPSSLT